MPRNLNEIERPWIWLNFPALESKLIMYTVKNTRTRDWSIKYVAPDSIQIFVFSQKCLSLWNLYISFPILHQVHLQVTKWTRFLVANMNFWIKINTNGFRRFVIWDAYVCTGLCFFLQKPSICLHSVLIYEKKKTVKFFLNIWSPRHPSKIDRSRKDIQAKS